MSKIKKKKSHKMTEMSKQRMKWNYEKEIKSLPPPHPIQHNEISNTFLVSPLQTI